MKSENAESRLVQLILPSPRVGPRPRLPMCHARVRLAAALLGTLAAACAPLQNAAQNQGHSLRASLPVAEAVLIAGQPAAARRLYLSLAERFDKAPEPALGLAYVALHAWAQSGSIAGRGTSSAGPRQHPGGPTALP